MMDDEQLESLIKEVSDPRTWRVAASLVDLAKKAQDTECGCDACIQLRAIAGALDDIHGERA